MPLHSVACRRFKNQLLYYLEKMENIQEEPTIKDTSKASDKRKASARKSVSKKADQNATKKKPDKPKKTAESKKSVSKIMKHVDKRKIPQRILERTLELVNQPPTHPFWQDRNLYCAPSIHQYRRLNPSNLQYELIKQARIHLVRREWQSLAEILSMVDDQILPGLLPLYTKYGFITMAHNDEEMLDLFLRSVYKYDEGPEAAIKLATSATEPGLKKARF